MDAVISPLLRARTWASPQIELRRRAATEADLGVVALGEIPAGAVLLALAHVFVDRPGRHTIQIDACRHQAGTDEIDDYLNHSCDPNSALDFTRLELRSLRPIAAGEELSFNYLTSEWDMAAPFTCRCGAPGCLGRRRPIQGFRHLEPAEQDLLAPLASPYLRLRLADLRFSQRTATRVRRSG